MIIGCRKYEQIKNVVLIEYHEVCARAMLDPSGVERAATPRYTNASLA